MDVALYTEGLPFTGNMIDQRSLGGSESAFIYLAREFAKQGHNVTAFCICSEEGVFHGVQYLSLAAWDSWRKEHTFDIFICSRFYQVFHQPIKAKVKILWCHDLFTHAMAPDMNAVFPGIDLIYCLSDYHVGEVVKIFPHQQHKIKKSFNGIDIESINETAAAVTEKKNKIIFNSRPERGLTEALEAYKLLNDPNLEFVICSYLYPNEVAGAHYLGQIEDLQRLGFNVTLQSFNKKELYRNLAESKLAIYPPHFPETFCISAVEAQACGTAYLTRPVAALAETVAYHPDTESGPAAFAAEMKKILENDELRAEIEKAGRQHVSRFTWDKVADNFLRDAAELLLTGVTKNNEAGAKKSRETTKENLPLISCLMVTSNRLILLKQAVNCYIDQTYPKKELIIVGSGQEYFRKGVEDYLTCMGRDDIHFVWYDQQDNNLGRKRNLSIDSSGGEILCLWDDDDLYHPQRLELQYNYMIQSNSQACFLSDHLQFFEQQQELFWIDWTFQDLLKKQEQMLPGSMMIFRDDRFHYPEAGPTSVKAEDNAFMDGFYGKIKVATLSNHGFLYIYRFHQRNIHSQMHHERVTAFGSREREYILGQQRPLLQALDYYKLPKPYFFKERNGNLIFAHLN